MKYNSGNTASPSWNSVAVNSANANLAANNITASSLTLSGYLMHSVNPAVSAAGTVQTDATALNKTINVITSGTLNQGVRLPAAAAGMVLYVTNASGATLKVYPATGAQINSLGTNTGLTIGANSTVHFIAPTTSQWYSTGATYA
jgi:hypothetical protein